MKYKLITALLLMAPAAAWAGVVIPEPEVLPLLAVGGVVAVAVKFMRKR
jgi:hypothetical protein